MALSQHDQGSLHHDPHYHRMLVEAYHVVASHLAIVAVVVAVILAWIVLASLRRARQLADARRELAQRAPALEKFVSRSRRPAPKRLEPPR